MCDETIQSAKARRAMTGRALAVPFLVCVMFSQNVKSEIPRGESVTDRPAKFAAAPMPAHSGQLSMLIGEALENNPEIQAALRAREAAGHRVSPAEALDDPVLEAGVINVPLASSPFNREDMTMKMIGLSQRLPFPGKRGLRKDVAAKDAEASVTAIRKP